MTEVDDRFSVGLPRRFHRKGPVRGARARVAEIVLDDRVAALEPVGCALERDVARGSAVSVRRGAGSSYLVDFDPQFRCFRNEKIYKG